MHGGRIGIEQVVHLVPFDLEGDEDGNDIVGVAHAGSVHGQRLLPVIKPFAPRRGRYRFPAIDMKALLLENLFRLAQQYQVTMDNRGRQAQHTIDEGRHIGIGRARLGMEARVDIVVCLHQRLQANLA